MRFVFTPHARWTCPIVVGVALAFALAGLTGTASAAVSCPSSNPIVNENNCQGPGSTGWQITNGNPNGVVGFAVSPSYNIGSSVPLKIASSNPNGVTINLSLYRMGYYGGKGGRLVYSASNIAVGNYINCNAMNSTTGEVDCNNWDITYTIPASAFPVSGVYIAKIVNPATGDDNQILIVIRNDSANSQVLVKIPTATYQAYNNWGGKSLYCQLSSGVDLIGDGCPRALAVSFERPLQNVSNQPNYFLHDEFALIYWLEEQGYDISYTDSTAIAQNPTSLLNHKVIVIGGHDEYWSGGELAAMKAARDAGVSIASFSSNTAFWKVEYENNYQTVTCYKTILDGSLGINDPGPDGPTTTFRDPGAPAGSPNAPPGGRVGVNDPENSLWGNMYIGDNDSASYPLVVPPANAQNQFAGDRIWRNTGINPNTGATIGTNLVGWEWDAIPSASSPLYSNFLGVQPAGVIPLTQSPVNSLNPEFLTDYGATYAATPPTGQPADTEAVKYRAPSGALVFAAGTIQWPWALGPYFIPTPGSGETYFQTPTNTEDPRIQQATYNILSDMGVQPTTPTGITPDANPSPSPSPSPNPSPSPSPSPNPSPEPGQAPPSATTPGQQQPPSARSTGGAGSGSGTGRRRAESRKPRLGPLRVVPHRFRAARHGPTLSAKRRAGTEISYRDSIAARTGFKVLRCARSRGRCGRLVRVGAFLHHDRRGINRVHFSGRLHGHALRPGRYVLRAVATRAHRRSRRRSAGFTILVRERHADPDGDRDRRGQA